MAIATTCMTHFSSWLEGALQMEETKRGLGKVFHTAVMTMLNENEGKTNEELAGIFTDTLKELANKYVDKLNGVPLREAVPSFTQYLSDYKRCLELCGYEIRKCGGVADVKKLLQATRDAVKEKEAGVHPDDTKAPTAKTASASGGGAVSSSGFSGEVQRKLDNALKALSQMSEAEALEVVSHFEGAAWKRVKVANRKAGVISRKDGAATKAA